eukprot:1879710-Rhodomonas_salina.1
MATLERPRKHGCSLVTDSIASQIKMRQRLAPPQRPRKLSRPLRADQVHSQIKMDQRPASLQQSCKPLRSRIVNLAVSQVQTSKCCAQRTNAYQRSRMPSPFQGDLKIRFTTKVPDECITIDICLRLFHQKDAPAVFRQVATELLANSEPGHNAFRRPDLPQQRRWQAKQSTSSSLLLPHITCGRLPHVSLISDWRSDFRSCTSQNCVGLRSHVLRPQALRKAAL